MTILRNIQLDTALPGSQLVLYARKGDARIYTLAVSLCERSVPVVLPETWRAAFRGKKPDGTRLYTDAAVSNGQVKVYLGAQAFTAEGVVKCQIDVLGANDELLYSPAFDILVEPAALEDAEIQSSDEFSALLRVLRSVDDMTVSIYGLPFGELPTATVTEENGHKHITFGIPDMTPETAEPAKWFTGTAVTGEGGSITAVVQGSQPGDVYIHSETSAIYNAVRLNTWRFVGKLESMVHFTGADLPMGGTDARTLQAAIDENAEAAQAALEALQQSVQENLQSALDTQDHAIALKLDKADVVNTLEEETSGKALDAAQGKALSQSIARHAEKIYYAVLPAEGWSEEAPFAQRVEVPGIQEVHMPDADILFSDDPELRASQKEAWGFVDRVWAYDGYIEVTCDEDKPEMELILRLKTAEIVSRNRVIAMAETTAEQTVTETSPSPEYPAPITGHETVTIRHTGGGQSETITLTPSTPLYGLEGAKDRISSDGRALRSSKRVLLNGYELDWFLSGSTSADGSNRFHCKLLDAPLRNNILLACSKFQAVTTDTELISGKCRAILVDNDSVVSVYFAMPGITTLADWRTYLANNPVELLYELAAPTTETIPRVPILGFSGADQFTSPQGDVHIERMP